MDFYIGSDKPRKKSIGRVDGTPAKKRSSLEAKASELGLDSFVDSLITKQTTRVRKGESLFILEDAPALQDDTVDKSISPDLIEHLAKRVHEAWEKTAAKSHANRVPYDELTEHQKDKDRNTVEAVLNELERMGLEIPEDDLISSLTIKKSNRLRMVCGNCGKDRDKDKDGTPCPKCQHDHLVYEGDQIQKADNGHLPKGAERCAYKTDTNYGIVYIPVNRLKQVYQTDDAINMRKVNENRRKMREGIPLAPVEIGYNYDVHDGHHRWEAAKLEGHTHVPCKVVGTDPEKVKRARKEYMDVWKSEVSEPLSKSLGGHLDFSKLVKKAVQVRGKNGQVFTRMQWVSPEQASTGHGVRRISSARDMQEAKSHGIHHHPQFWDALKDQGLDPHTMGEHSFRHHPHFFLPETEESADEARFYANHSPHGSGRVRNHKVYQGNELIDKQDDYEKFKQQKMDAAHNSKDIHSTHELKHLDSLKLRSGTSLVEKYQSKLDDLVSKYSQANPDFETDVAGGNIYKHVHDVMKGTTVEGLQHVFSKEGVFSSKLSDFDVDYDPDLDSVGVHLGMSLYDNDGKYIGMATRSISSNNNFESDEPMGHLVNNKLFEIDKEAQGSGLAGHLYERSEEYWKHLADGGNVHIFMTANVTVGTYAWAKKGFDFSPDDRDNLVANKHHELHTFLEAHGLDPKKTAKACGLNRIEDIRSARDFAELDNGMKFDPTEVADRDYPFDDRYRASHRKDVLDEAKLEPMHLGKAFMLFGAKSWHGYKKI